MAQGKSSKQKRQAQNRAARQAQAARRAASQPTAGAAPAARPAGRGGRFGSLFNPRPPAAGAAAGRAAAAADQPVGYRAALSAFLAIVAAVVISCTALRQPVDADGDLYTSASITTEWATSAVDAAAAAPGDTPKELAASIDDWTPGRSSELYAVAAWPFSAMLVLPVLAGLLAFQAVRTRRPSKVVNRAMFAVMLGAFLNQGVFVIMLPGLIGFVVASFQIRKAELAALQAEAAAGAAVGDPATGEVVEVDEVEADEADEADGATPSTPGAG